MRDENNIKYLTVAQLKAALEQCPLEWRVYPNIVGNLTLTDDQTNDRGWIDFAEEGEVF